jgi:quinoprotein glucose dehydrogenase
MFRFLTFAPLVLISSLLNAQGPSTDEHAEWRHYGGAADSAQYSSLRQVNRSNVTQLQVAWRYLTGDNNRYSFNPLVVDRTAYVLAHNNSIVAVDAVTGKEVWIHSTDPQTRLITNRGINYWQSADGSDRRLFFSVDNFLQAIDARTGKSITSFGTEGKVDLRQGLGRDPESLVLVQSLTPGRIFEDLIILGSATNQEYESGPGDIRAYDVRTGRQVWIFHTIPHPGEFGYDTWPKDAWKRVGGANAWSELTVDEKRAIVYIPVGSPKYNFYGANRHGANLFGDCLVALDARTGKRLWHFQMVHHDIWDYDPATAPKLLTVRHNGQLVDVVAQVTKQGFVFVFNRVTGEPLWPIEERPVPRTDMPGEKTWPTQPFPTQPPPFARQKFTVDDLSPYIADPAERARFRDELLSARNEGLFTPPGTRNTVQMPGNNGGANWSGAAVDPTNGTLYVVSKDLPAMLKLELEKDVSALPQGTPEQQGRALYEAKCQICHHGDLKGQPPAVPSLVNIGSRLTDAQIHNVIAHGQGLMPAVPGLSPEEMNRLTAYLLHTERATTVPPADRPKEVAPSSPETAHYRSGFGFMVTSTGLSPIKPPWTSLTAYDLNQGTIKWKRPLGEVPELAKKGITDTGAHFPKVGPVVTAGGLIFTGTRDRKVRALDSSTGAVLWEAQVDAALEGMPAVYSVDGREYIVFCAAAQPATALLGTPGHPATQGKSQNGAYIAFALPR